MLLRNISVDCVIFGFEGEKLNVLLWQADPRLLMQTLRENEDYEQLRILYDSHPSLQTDSTWGLIGAHAPEESDLDEYAQEITTGCTGLTNVYLKQFHTFGDSRRVPYYRVITVGYYALINPRYHNLHTSTLTRRMQWFDINHLPPLCFDHREIIITALEHDTLRALYLTSDVFSPSTAARVLGANVSAVERRAQRAIRKLCTFYDGAVAA